jgi:hypothetical protein
VKPYKFEELGDILAALLKKRGFASYRGETSIEIGKIRLPAGSGGRFYLWP